MRRRAPTRLGAFIAGFEAKYPKATGCLVEDQEALPAFFAMPAAHWLHLRTSNLIEWPRATVRLRQRVTKGAGSRTKGLLMAFKLFGDGATTTERGAASRSFAAATSTTPASGHAARGHHERGDGPALLDGRRRSGAVWYGGETTPP